MNTQTPATQTSAFSLEQCRIIYDHASRYHASKGYLDAAKRYLDAGDADGFERVCRGDYAWLREIGAPEWLRDIRARYVLTDGPAEAWHDNGQQRSKAHYINGQLHGLFEDWHDNGQQWSKATYVNGQQQGQYEMWYPNGQQRMKCTYVDGQRHGRLERWHDDGQRDTTSTYINGKLL
jgi:MORN repeat variant